MMMTAAAVALGVSAVAVAVLIRLAHRYGWFDTPDDRKIHDGEIPCLGGIGMGLGIAAGLAVVVGVLELPLQGALVAAGLVLVHVVGVVDDVHNIRAGHKFLL